MNSILSIIFGSGVMVTGALVSGALFFFGNLLAAIVQAITSPVFAGLTSADLFGLLVALVVVGQMIAPQIRRISDSEIIAKTLRAGSMYKATRVPVWQLASGQSAVWPRRLR